MKKKLLLKFSFLLKGQFWVEIDYICYLSYHAHFLYTSKQSVIAISVHRIVSNARFVLCGYLSLQTTFLPRCLRSTLAQCSFCLEISSFGCTFRVWLPSEMVRTLPLVCRAPFWWCLVDIRDIKSVYEILYLSIVFCTVPC